ncbi:MAG: diol dehydratase reactivase subunit alpha, partial [Desulfocucumaceae bacterium]
PIARALTGIRSGVVIKTPRGDVKERRIPAGRISIEGRVGRFEVNIEDGAPEIMAAVEKACPINDIQGEPGTNIGGMVSRIRQTMGELTSQPAAAIRIQDILAVDTMVQQTVSGGLAGELSSESAVALGAMVKTTRLPMEQVAGSLRRETGVEVRIAGVEAEMAVLGALTTPGIDRPLAILDMGGGSTDAALITREGVVNSVHLAGAGDMVTMLIDSELALNDRELAEEIKRCPLAKVESLFQVRLEDGTVRFFERALDPKYFARVVILKENGMVPLPTRHTMERIRLVRRQSKERVFITNCLRALKRVAPTGNIRRLDFVAMVGGSALDFEIPGMIAGELAGYGVVAGRANVRGSQGPRNAVATGLILSCNP